MTFLVDKMSPNLFSNKIPNQPAHLKLSVCLHSVETLGMRKVVSSQGDNYTPAPPSKNTPMCIVTPPTTIFVFNCALLCLLWHGLLFNMSGRKHLRCSLGLFARPGSNHLAKLRNPNWAISGSKLFVCLSFFFLLSPMLTIYRNSLASREKLSQSRSRSFVSSSFIFCSPNIRS